MAASEALAVEEYKSSLGDLEMNSKPIINMLTMLAEENINYAPGIVNSIEDHINTVSPQLQLPAMYLLDSILKNVQNEGSGSVVYRPLFARNIVPIFLTVFEKAEESTRHNLFKLRQTWKGYLPNSKLYAIDLKVATIDPAWPVTLPDRGAAAEQQPNPSTKIHVNPKFLNKGLEKSAEPAPKPVGQTKKSTVVPDTTGDSDMRPRDDTDMRKSTIKPPQKKRSRGNTPTRDRRDSASSSSAVADCSTEKPDEVPSKSRKSHEPPPPELPKEPVHVPKDRDQGHQQSTWGFNRGGRGGPRSFGFRGGPRGGPRGRGGSFNPRNDGPPFRRGAGNNGPMRPFSRNTNNMPVDKPPFSERPAAPCHPPSMPGSQFQPCQFEAPHQRSPNSYNPLPDPVMSGPSFSRGGLLHGPPRPQSPITQSNQPFSEPPMNTGQHQPGLAGPSGPGPFPFSEPPQPPPMPPMMNGPPMPPLGMGGFGVDNMMQAEPPAPPKLPPVPPQPPSDPIPANNRIFVDGRAYEVQFVDDIPVIERNGVPHKIYFTGPPREVVIDGVAHSLAFGDRKTVNIDGQSHTIRFGAPSRELYMGSHPFRGAFGGPPIYATINGNRHRIYLNGPPPEVKIETEPCHELLRFMPRHAANRQAIDYGSSGHQTETRNETFVLRNPANGNRTDVNSIVQNLMKSGILSALQNMSSRRAGAERHPQPAASTQPVTPPRPCPQYSEDELVEKRQTRPPLDLKNFSLRSLKIRYQPVVEGLYPPSANRCSTCGLRFESLNSVKYQQHLDRHYRESTRAASNLSRQRPWYMTPEKWIIGFDETEDMVQRVRNSGQEDSSIDESNPELESGPSRQGNVIDAVEGETTCSVCQEIFDQFWDEEGEIWKFRNALLVDGKVYHPQCFPDSEGTAEDAEPPTPFFPTSCKSFSGLPSLPGLEVPIKEELKEAEGAGWASVERVKSPSDRNLMIIDDDECNVPLENQAPSAPAYSHVESHPQVSGRSLSSEGGFLGRA